LFLFVKYGNLKYVLAAALAILINFSARYFIARSWVWKQKAPKKG
jgi:putative flippase GtrA